MKALLCETLGPPENLVVREIVEPVPAQGEVIVDVAFAALNFFDTLIIEGKYQVRPSLPFSPCGEFAGTIGAVGTGVTAFRPGDRVAGYCGHGAARQRLACPIEQLVPLPPALSLERSAGLIVTYATSLHALRQRADLRSGESLAVLGASGGVGLAAVEIGRLLGARVIACASSREKLEFAAQRGATETIDYSRADLKDELKRITAPNGVDVVYDPVGGELTEAALRALAWGGRLLVVGFAAGPIPKLPLNLVLLKGCDVRGVFWGDFVKREPAAHRENLEEIVAWAAEGELESHVHAIFPMQQAAHAMGLLTSRKARGKVLLRP